MMDSRSGRVSDGRTRGQTAATDTTTIAIEQFPVTREQIRAVLEFVARSLEVLVPAR